MSDYDEITRLWSDEELDREIEERMKESRTLTVVPLPANAAG